MLLAKVIKPVVCTVKDKSFVSKKIFVVQPLNQSLAAAGPTLLAFDSGSAGPGDTVLVCREGNGCRQIWGDSEAPVNSIIVGIVDAV
jgi:microcompartment protein CcmK/EutM